MKCHKVGNAIICGPFDRVEATIDGVRIEYTPRWGPVRIDKAGDPTDNQNFSKSFWRAFDRWRNSKE